MKDPVTLTLSRLDAGQVLDALHERMHIWQITRQYLETGHSDPTAIIEECSDPDEAQSIADYYQSIIETIEAQLKEQSGEENARFD